MKMVRVTVGGKVYDAKVIERDETTGNLVVELPTAAPCAGCTEPVGHRIVVPEKAVEQI